MTMNNKVFANLEMLGETLVVIAAALWILHLSWIPYVFAIGAIFTAVGRFAQTNPTDSTALKHLFRLRRYGVIALLLSAALMFVKGTQYLGYEVYLFPSSWLIFFVVFAVIEIYTTVRILHLTREK